MTDNKSPHILIPSHLSLQEEIKETRNIGSLFSYHILIPSQ